MPVLPRWRDEVGELVEELLRREVDDAVLSMGGGPKKATVVANNAGVLEALIALTGKNFAWDAAAWRTWLASQQSPPPGYDPRRGGP